MVYQPVFRYLPHSIHFSEFMPIIFMRKWTEQENTRRPPFSYDTKMAVQQLLGAHSLRKAGVHYSS